MSVEWKLCQLTYLTNPISALDVDGEHHESENEPASASDFVQKPPPEIKNQKKNKIEHNGLYN